MSELGSVSGSGQRICLLCSVSSASIFLLICFFLVFWIWLFLRQGFSLSWNSLFRPGWPWTQKSACLCLPSAVITGLHDYHLALFYSIKIFIPCRPMVVPAFNPSILEAVAGRFLSSRPAWSTDWVPGQPELNRETLSQKTNKQPNKQTNKQTNKQKNKIFFPGPIKV